MIRSISILVIAFELHAADVALLRKAGARVEAFQDQFQAVTCTERLVQTKLGENGKAIIRKESAFDYLVVFQVKDGDLAVDESRVLRGKPEKAGDQALLATSGFSTLLLIFHPLYRDDFRFIPQGPDPLTKLERVRFEHIHGKRSPSVLELRGRNYPIDWQGTAWIDEASGNIARIDAGIESPMDDVGLKKLETDVRYAPVHFASAPDFSSWLPQTAIIEAGTVHQHWRNEHQFTQYRQFAVDTSSETEAPKQQ